MSWPTSSPPERDVSTLSEQPPESGSAVRSMLREMLETLLFTLLIFFLVRSVIQNFKVEGSSMEPNFHTGQYIMVNRMLYVHVDLNLLKRLFSNEKDLPTRFGYLFHLPRRGDVVVFEYPRDTSRDFIKRIIGLPGETVQIQNNQVLINGVPLAEPYLSEAARGQMGSLPPTVVPPDSVFVMGDNRGNSSDSRSWGALPLNKIVGKAWFIYWPRQYWGLVPPAAPTLAAP
jgi:signal peptidase I